MVLDIETAKVDRCVITKPPRQSLILCEYNNISGIRLRAVKKVSIITMDSGCEIDIEKNPKFAADHIRSVRKKSKLEPDWIEKSSQSDQNKSTAS